jgi:hypothetical protein
MEPPKMFLFDFNIVLPTVTVLRVDMIDAVEDKEMRNLFIWLPDR